MAVRRGGGAVGGPAGVGDAGVGIKDLLQVDIGLVDELLELGHLANLLEGHHLIPLVAIDS